MPDKDYNSLAGQKISRVEALSDGIFAIAMTLLVLEIKIPGEFHTEGELITAFLDHKWKFLSYLLGFITLGIFWVGHSTQFKFIKRVDRHLTWLSIVFLMFASLMPFSTAFLSEHMHLKTAVGIYWLNIFLLGVTILIHWVYAYRNGLVDDSIDKEAINKAICGRVVFAQAAYALGALVCFFSTYLSVAIIVLIQLNYAFAFFYKPGNETGSKETPPDDETDDRK